MCLNSESTWPNHVMSHDSAKMVPTSALKRKENTHYVKQNFPGGGGGGYSVKTGCDS